MASIVVYEGQLRAHFAASTSASATTTSKSFLLPPLGSPRSLAACLRVGLTPEELQPLTRQEFDLLHPPILASPVASPRKGCPPLVRQLPPEAQEKKYVHYKARLFEKIQLVKDERRSMIMKERGEDGWHYLHEDVDAGGYVEALSASAAIGGATTTTTFLPPSSPLNSNKHTHTHRALSPAFSVGSHHSNTSHSGGGGAGGDVVGRAAHLKSAMMEMEKRRIEAVKKRQEKDFLRLIDGEQKMVQLQQKLLAAQEEEVKKKKAHEKVVEAHRKAEIEKKKQRDHDLQLQAEENQKREREMARKDAVLKAKLASEARTAERNRRKEAVAREQERFAKLDALRKRTEGILQQQELAAEAHRRVIDEREARVKAQVDAKKEAKAAEVLAQRLKAEKRIKETLLKNQAIQQQKRQTYEVHAADGLARAQHKHTILLQAAAKAGDERRAMQARREQRLVGAAQGLQDKITRTLTRAEERSNFYAKVAAEQEKTHLLSKLDKDLRQEDKLENVKRIQRKEAFDAAMLMAKQEADNARYEQIKEERAYLLQQRTLTAHQAMLRKHKLKEALEKMQITNKFVDLGEVFVEGGKGGKGGKEKEEDGEGRAGTAGAGGGRPQSRAAAGL